MKTLGNIIWLVCGGLMTSIEYAVSSVLMMVTIIGIPFGLQTLKLAVLALWPFGSRIVRKEHTFGCLNLFMDILWFFVGGIWTSLTHLFWGILLFITIIGIPFARQHFKLSKLALFPFGKEVFINGK